jgi:hypothetical protein
MLDHSCKEPPFLKHSCDIVEHIRLLACKFRCLHSGFFSFHSDSCDLPVEVVLMAVFGKNTSFKGCSP